VAAPQLEVDVLHRFELALAEHTLLEPEALGQRAHLQHHGGVRVLGLGLHHVDGGAGLLGRLLRDMVVDHHQPRRVAFQAGAAGQQGPGVVVLRAGKDLRHRPLLADDAVAHHHHMVGHLAHHAQIVADEQHAHAPRGLELADELQDLALDGDVQRRGGLVGDQQLGFAGQGHRDHHALLLAPRHLVRVGGHAPRRLRDAHLAQQFLSPLPGLGLG
jgi:hypothetical protein